MKMDIAWWIKAKEESKKELNQILTYFYKNVKNY